MRLTRRRVLGLGIGISAASMGGVLLARSGLRGSDDIASIKVESRSIAQFSPDRPDQQIFGELTFRGGLVLSSAEPGFGGWSALWRSIDGTRLVAVSDNALWLTADVVTQGGRGAGLTNAVIAPILGENGVPLRHGPAYDTESLAIADGIAFIGIERVHEVRRFEWGALGVRAPGVPIPVAPQVKTLPSNQSLEAVAVAPPDHPLAGGVVAIAERAQPGNDAPTFGWIVTGPQAGAFRVARSKGYDVTDLNFLPGGEALLLERRFTMMAGVACRIRRIGQEDIRPGALVEGRVIFEADRRFEIDNMEGIATHRDTESGATVVTLISDDNYNPLQRTLLLEFTLAA